MICYYPDFSSLLLQGQDDSYTVILPSGAVVRLQKYGAGSYQVTDLCSTDPQEFLTGSLRPGQTISHKQLLSLL